ncbi:BTAD domain-containing putative transcriptional regulator [Microbacterium sp. NPDC057659]|uniref:AfsR/SARP family transcriptional regulator n=1 Tax=Microbacterium sp. NPDC057659 TaxID=3346198 RepID=UPI00366F52E9
MRFETLGPLRVFREDADVTPPGRVQRLVLATLLLQANHPVPVEALTDGIWPDEPPSTAQSRLQLAVHRLRSRLDDPARLSLDPGGYRLRVGEDESDVTAFDRLAAGLLVDQLTPDQVVDITSEALSLWRGEPLEDVVELADSAEALRWADRRRWVVEAWCHAQLLRGRSAEVIDRAAAALACEPLHEPYAAVLMRALHAAGRPADALAVYERIRIGLRDELGLDPGPALREAQSEALGEEASWSPITVPAELPPDVPLTGRDDLLELIGNPEQARLRVVTGMAGAGKTAAAVAWSHRHLGSFPDGQIFIDLRGYSDDAPAAPADALASVLASLGLAHDRIPTGVEARAALWRSLTAARRMLVVLDNARETDQVRPMLTGGADSTVIVTSRNALPGLSAREGAEVVVASPLTPEASVTLLRGLIGRRADDDPAAVRELARVCGDLPLALRIAAQELIARQDLTPAELLAEVCDERDRLDLLDADDGDATDIRAVISWSYRALQPESAQVFRRLGLLPGADIDLPALTALCDMPEREVRRRAEALVRIHLAQRSATGRYRQHDLLRAYAAERAAEDGAEAASAARTRLLTFYARGAQEAQRVSFPDGEYLAQEAIVTDGPIPEFAAIPEAQDWLRREWPNALAALERAEDGDADLVLALAKAWHVHLRDNGLYADGLRLHEQEVKVGRRTGNAIAEYGGHVRLGANRRNLGDLAGAEREYRTAIRIAESIGDPARRARSTGNLAMITALRGRLHEAEELLEQVMPVLREHDGAYSIAIGLSCLAECRLRSGDPEGAEELLQEGLRLCDEGDLPMRRPGVLLGLADAAFNRGRVAESEGYARDAERLAEEVGEPKIRILALAAVGRARLRLDDEAAGHDALRTAIGLARGDGSVEVAMSVLEMYVEATADRQVATAMHREAVAYAAEHGFTGHEARMRAALGTVLADRGDAERARAELTLAAEMYAVLEDPRAETAAALAERIAPATTARISDGKSAESELL